MVRQIAEAGGMAAREAEPSRAGAAKPSGESEPNCGWRRRFFFLMNSPVAAASELGGGFANTAIATTRAWYGSRCGLTRPSERCHSSGRGRVGAKYAARCEMRRQLPGQGLFPDPDSGRA